MNDVITESNLLDRLENIKLCIQEIKCLDTKNVVFLDLASFFNYIDKYNTSKKKSTSSIQTQIKEVQPYIPLAINDESLKLFLNAALVNDEQLMQSLEDSFIQNSTTRFINAVYNANDDDAWKEIINVCVKIREYKEAGLGGLI